MDSEPVLLTKRVRLLISILIIGHLLALVLPPLSVQTRGSIGQSPSVSTALDFFEPYSQALYIDRGYAFFAPDPGPSHLIQVAISRPEEPLLEKMYPDRNEQWPRLLYHRHFMLSEFMHEIYQPPGPSEELLKANRQEARYWSLLRARYKHVHQSIVDHLKYEYPGDEVAIRRIEHLVPDLIDYQQEPIELTDKRLYRVLLDKPIEQDANE